MSPPPPVPGAAIGPRIAAALLDVALMGILLVVLSLLFGDARSKDGEVSVELKGAAAGVYFALALLYYFGLEAATGQTLGKRLLGLRVLRADGTPAGPVPIAIRTLLRIVDFLPFFYLVGFVSVLATGSKEQRLGDLAAGTVVRRA